MRISAYSLFFLGWMSFGACQVAAESTPEEELNQRITDNFYHAFAEHDAQTMV